MGLEFVNIHGNAVDLTPPKTRRAKKVRDAHHDGWLATGVSPHAVEQAKAKAKALSNSFDLQFFLRTAKREKIRSKPYFSRGAANEACGLAERAGWLHCYTIERATE